MLRGTARVLLLCAVFALGIAGSANAAEILYGITFGNQLIRIDTATGIGTLVGPLDTPMAAFGLGTRVGRLYTFDQTADRIRELDPNTGATITTIDIGVGNLIGEGSLTFRNDGIGFMSRSSGGVGDLFSFDITVPSSTAITPPGGLVPSMDGMDFSPGGLLYGLSQDTSALHTIDQATGATTLIGDTGLDDTNTLSGLAFRSNGALFAEISDALYTLDPATGLATLVGLIGFSDVSGLTFLSVTQVPEPPTSALFSTGLSGLAALARRRRRRARQAHYR